MFPTRDPRNGFLPVSRVLTMDPYLGLVGVYMVVIGR